jgi:hypothetical protein
MQTNRNALPFMNGVNCILDVKITLSNASLTLYYVSTGRPLSTHTKEQYIRYYIVFLLILYPCGVLIPDVSVHVHLDTCQQGADHVGTLLLQLTAVQCTWVTDQRPNFWT